MSGLISFIGAGPGAADLITLRGADRLRTADVVIWASSLVPEAVLGPLGLGDDALVAAWLAGAFLVETERYLSWEHARPLGGFLGDH